MRKRFNLDLLDEDDPFEFDTGNTPHLMKRQFDPDDVRDVWANEPVFWQAAEDGAADWIMVGYVPGEVLVVPLAPSRSGDPRQARPIGIRKADDGEKHRYEVQRRRIYGG
ncbi:MAG: hypothetical protein HY658_01050 [Actinobacteria bacterium]|nr:hypothetical protein [Actinomycetota bacterium]